MRLSIIAATFNMGTRVEALGKSARMTLGDTVQFLIASLLLLTLVGLVIRHFKRRRKRVPGGEKVYRSISVSGGEDDEDGAESDMRVRYKRRRRRRDHRKRNPTLAETGGMPPARSGDQKEAS